MFNLLFPYEKVLFSISGESAPKYYHVESRILFIFEITDLDYSKETLRLTL